MNKRQIGLMVIIGGIFIFFIKLLAYFTSDSVALLSDAMESIVNIVASIMMFAALVISERPADANHRYGHQKSENLSCFVEGLLIIIAAVLIIEATIGRIMNPIELSNVNLSLLISIAATSLNGVLGLIMLRESRKSRSIALEGDAKHLFSDVVSSVGVVVGLFVASLTGWYFLDPLIALVVAGLLIIMGVKVLKKASIDLMDHNCPEEEGKIKEVVGQFPGVSDCVDVKTRRNGDKVYADVHVSVDGSLTVLAAEQLSAKLTEELEKHIPGIVMNIKVGSAEKGLAPS